MDNKIQLSIVLPAHNEADNLPSLIKEVTEYMQGLGWDYEIIIVNDGSTDKTKEVSERLQGDDNRIKLVNHPKNRGYGGALRSGYRQNRQDHLIRKINAGIFNLAVNILFGLWIRDIDCAFKLIKKEVVDKADLESNGALINTELLVRAKKLGYRIKQLPVSHYPRLSGTQSGASIKVILRAIKEILLFRLTDRTVSSSERDNK